MEKLKDEVIDILDISNFTSEHLQDDIIGPRIISMLKELGAKNKQIDGYYTGYARSPFTGFESYLRIAVGLYEDDIQLLIKNNTIKLLSLMNYSQEFTQLKIL